MATPDILISEVRDVRVAVLENGSHKTRVIVGRDKETELRRQVGFLAVIVQKAIRHEKLPWDEITALRPGRVGRLLEAEIDLNKGLVKGLMANAARKKLMVAPAFVLTHSNLGVREVPGQLSLWSLMGRGLEGSFRVIDPPARLSTKFAHPNR